MYSPTKDQIEQNVRECTAIFTKMKQNFKKFYTHFQKSNVSEMSADTSSQFAGICHLGGERIQIVRNLRKSKTGRYHQEMLILLIVCVWSGPKMCQSCRSRKTLQNTCMDAKIGVGTVEIGPFKVSSEGLGPSFSALRGARLDPCASRRFSKIA